VIENLLAMPARHQITHEKADASAEPDRLLRLWPFMYWGSYFWRRLEEGAWMVPRVEPGVEFLQDPFTADALNRRVREVLDG
jgi:hypothetical protein